MFYAVYGVSEADNWHEMPGQTVLSMVSTSAEAAKQFELSVAEVDERLAAERSSCTACAASGSDVLVCQHCGGRRELLSLILDLHVVEKILRHQAWLGLASEPPEA